MNRKGIYYVMLVVKIPTGCPLGLLMQSSDYELKLLLNPLKGLFPPKYGDWTELRPL